MERCGFGLRACSVLRERLTWNCLRATNAAWAYVLGAAIAIKKECRKAAVAAEAIGEDLQAFCIPGSVAEDRKVGVGHGNLAAMLLLGFSICRVFVRTTPSSRWAA